MFFNTLFEPTVPETQNRGSAGELIPDSRAAPNIRNTERRATGGRDCGFQFRNLLFLLLAGSLLPE